MFYAIAVMAAFIAGWLVLVAVLDRLGRAVAGRTGLARWARRVRLVERRLDRPGLWRAFTCAAGSAVGLVSMAAAIVAAPQSPWERQDGFIVFGLAAVMAALAVVLGVRWWRVSSYYLP